MNFVELIVTLAIFTGQIVKIPLSNFGGLTILDISAFLLVGWGLLKLKLRLKKPPLYMNIGLAFTFLGLSSLAITPLHLSPTEFLASIFYPIRLAVFLLLAWVAYSGGLLINSSKFFIFCGFLLALVGIIQLLIIPDLYFLQQNGWDPHYFRVVSTFLDPNFLGAFLVISLIIMFQNLAIAKKWNIALFSLIYLTLLLTFSRSSYLMFFISFSSLSLLKKSIKVFILSVTLSAGLFLGFQIYTYGVTQPRNIDRGKSASSRINTWQQGNDIFQKSPIIGVGFNSYRFALREYGLAGDEFLSSHGSSSNDSSLLFVLSTTGIIGIIVYLSFLLSIAKSNLTALSIVLGLLAHSIFNNSLFYPPLLLSILFLPILNIPKK